MIDVWADALVGVGILLCVWFSWMYYVNQKKKECHYVAAHEDIYVEDIAIPDPTEMVLLLAFDGKTAEFFLGVEHPDFEALWGLLRDTPISLTPLNHCIEGLNAYRASSYARFQEVLVSPPPVPTHRAVSFYKKLSPSYEGLENLLTAI